MRGNKGRMRKIEKIRDGVSATAKCTDFSFSFTADLLEMVGPKILTMALKS